MKINFRLLLIVLEISLIPLFFLGFVAYSNSKSELTNSVVARLEAIADIQKNRLENQNAVNLERLKLLTSRSQLRIETDNYNKTKNEASQGTMRNILLDAIKSIPDFKEISILDLNGIAIASTNQAAEGRNYASAEYFTKGRDSNQVFNFSKDSSGIISLHLSGPLVLAGQTLGVLVVTTDGTNISSIVTNYAGLGYTGETLLVKKDPNGDVIFLSPSRFDPHAGLTRVIPKSNTNIPSVHAILGEEQTFLNAKDYQDAPVFAVTRYISGAGWGIVAKISQSEAFLPINKLRSLLAFICLISVILIFFISYSIAESITNPIIILKQRANKIAAGDLSQNITVSTNDEIGELASAFTIMTTKLKESNTTLENKVLDRTKDLEAAKAKDDALLGSIGDGVIAVDKFNKIVFINKVAIDMLELSESDVLGKDAYDAFRVEDEQENLIPLEKRPLYGALSATTTVTNTIGGHTYYYSRPGKPPIPVGITVTPVMIEGKIAGAVEIFRDISQELAIDRQKSEFISLASHQLRTPLGSMRWNLEMIESVVKYLPPEAQERMHETYKSNMRVIRLVGELLNITRIEQGKIQDIPLLANIKEIIEGAVKEMEPEALKRKVSLEVKFKKQDMPKITIDPGRFREVIQNLLSNAVKYTLSGGTVSVEADATDKSIEISVADSGIGIPEKEKSKIFTKFARAENASRVDTEGSGLGLFIVRSFVERWGGKVWFESVENKGSTFYMSLPLVPKAAGSAVF